MDKDLLAARLNDSEGRRSKLYKDTVGKWTIGVGRNLSDKGLSEDEIDYLLSNDIRDALLDLDRKFPWWRDLDPVRQLVLADMSFNLGINKLSGFVNTMRYIKAGDYKNASQGMLNSLWARQVKGRAVELAEMMRTGNLPDADK